MPGNGWVLFTIRCADSYGSAASTPTSFNNMHSIKKAFSTFVTFTTVLWSMGGALLFPGVAQAATLSPGDLIKASGPAVYYYAADGKRYVFPNEKTYFSWYNDFSSVVTITDAELAAIMIGGNVTIRPGTSLVKITTDPKVYAISSNCGMLHWIQSETLAQQLYGANWAQRVVDVPDAFFVDYEVGSPISSAVHPDGTVVNYASNPSMWYVVWNGQKRELQGTAAADNMLNPATWGMTTTIDYTTGSPITGKIAELSDVGCPSATPSVTGGVTVTLASDTPAGVTVPRNSSSNAVVKVNLTAGNAAARVNGLRFKRVGVGNASDIANAYVYDQNKVRLTTGRTINSTTHEVEFSSLGIDVPANSTVAVYVYLDFSVASGSEGGVHAMQLADAASVVIEGTGTVTGNFPITGNSFTVGAASAARVDVEKGVTPSNPTIGAKDKEISNFRITANTNDVEIRQINVYQAGSVNNSDLSNFKLWQGSTLVATGGAVSSDNLITLVFNPAFVITNGTTKVFSLTADVGGRAGRTIRTYVEYTTDVTAIDKVYNAGAFVCINNTVTGCTTGNSNFDGTGANYVEVTTEGGTLTVTFNGPTTQNVAKGTLGVPLFNVTLTAADSALEIRKLNIVLTAGGGGVVKGSAGTEYFRNFRLRDINTGVTVMGPINMPSGVANSAATTGAFTFTDSWNLNANQVRDLELVADISNSEDAANELFGDGNNTYTLTMNAFGSSDVRVVDTGEFLATSQIVPNSNIVGNPLTVKASSLSAALATNPVGTTIVKKQADVDAVGITLSAGQQSDVTITSMKVSGMAQTAFVPGYTAAKFGQLVTSLKLFDGTTQLGTAKAPNTTTGDATFTGINLLIPKGTTKQLTVKATLSSTVSTTTSTDDFAIGIAAAADITAQDGDANTVNATLSAGLVANASAAGQTVIQSVRNSGTITYQQDSHPQTTILVAGGSTWKVFSRYKATAQYESAELDRVQVIHPNDGGKNGDFSMIAVAVGGDVTNRQDILSAGATGTKDVDMSQNKITVPKDGSVNFELWGQISSLSSTSSATANSPRSGDTPSLGVATNTQTGEWDANYAAKINIRATGLASGERLYDGAKNGLVGNTMVLRKTKPTVTKLAVGSTTITNGADTELYKFQVTPDANGGSVAWKQIIFTVSFSGTQTLNNFRLYKGSQMLSVTPGSREVFITGATGTDLTGSNNLQGNTVVVRLVNEESVSGSGTVYTLRATPNGASTGDSIATQFKRNTTGTVTGYLTDDGGVSGYVGSLGIDTAVSPDNTSNADGSFVWSDNVDVPHSFASGTAGGSRDWTDDVLVEDLTQTQSLSKS